jgi:hypothetical protein
MSFRIVMTYGRADSPPWQRRGGCAHLIKISRSVLGWAQTGWFVQATDDRKVERTISLLLRPIGLAGVARPSAPAKGMEIFS